MKQVGIVSYGVYVPRYRIKLSEIARVWNKNGNEVAASLGLQQKSVAATDEDAVTLAYEAGIQALENFPLSPQAVEVVLIGSESHPYAVNPTATTVAEFLQIGNSYLAADLQFACKAATAGIQAIAGLIGSGQMRFGIAIGTDTAQSKPHDILEYTSGAASAAFLLGNEHLVARLLDFTSFSSDTPDFWRRDGVRFPSHAGRFTGMPAYFTHVVSAAERLLKKTGRKPSEMDYCVFHMPNGKFPQSVARQLGFSREQLTPSLIVFQIGNPYSASSMVALANVLDQAKSGDLIFMVSYGSGAGSDAFLWEVTGEIVKLQTQRAKMKIRVKDFLERETFIDYAQYLKQTHKI